MTIQEKIDHDLREAMRARAAEKLSVLRMAKSALINAVIEKLRVRGGLSDPEALTVIRRQVKQRQDAIVGFAQGGRLEMAEKERREIAILEEYLPRPMAGEEIAQLVREAIEEAGASSPAQMGQVMKIATQKAASRVDGKSLSHAVQDELKRQSLHRPQIAKDL